MRSRLCLMALVIFLGPTLAWSADSDKATTSARWAVQPDPPATPLEWPASLNFNIPQPPRQEEILFPRENSPFCLVGLEPYGGEHAELWNLFTGKRVSSMQGTPAQSNRRAISGDGKYMGLAVLDRARVNDVEVWSLETGKRLAAFQADERNLPMTALDFAGPDELITYTFGQLNGKFVNHLRVWDAKTGTPLRQMDLEKGIAGDKKYDISPGGHWMAAIIIPDVFLIDMETGQFKGRIVPPTRTEDGQSVSIDAVRFSPDGSELAVYSEGQSSAVLAVHDLSTGDQKLKHELTAAMKNSLQHPASYKGPVIEYVSQPAGFFWHGSAFIERETGLMLWTYKQGILEFSHWKRLLTPAGMIVSTGGNGARKLRVIPFPAESLQKTLEAYRGDGPALIKPGEKVQLKITVGAVRYGKPDEAKVSIEKVLASRLADDGLEVADGGSTILAIKYKEEAGKTLQEFKGGSPLKGGTPTGRTVQSTSAELDFLWTTKDGKTKLFEHKLNLDPNMLMIRNKEPTDAVIREHVFEILKLQLAGLPMPYFVSTDKSLVSLPITTNSEMASPASAEDNLKKKIDAKKNLIKKK